MDMDTTKAKQEIEKLTANLSQEKRVFDSAHSHAALGRSTPCLACGSSRSS